MNNETLTATIRVMTPCKSLGIVVARLIYRGFVGKARKLAATNPHGKSWTVAESRAIIGACEYLDGRGLTHEDCVLLWIDVLGWS